jgi:hypothetical protein
MCLCVNVNHIGSEVNATLEMSLFSSFLLTSFLTFVSTVFYFLGEMSWENPDQAEWGGEWDTSWEGGYDYAYGENVAYDYTSGMAKFGGNLWGDYDNENWDDTGNWEDAEWHGSNDWYNEAGGDHSNSASY